MLRTTCDTHLMNMIQEQLMIAENGEVMLRVFDNPRCDACNNPAVWTGRYHTMGSGFKHKIAPIPSGAICKDHLINGLRDRAKVAKDDEVMITEIAKDDKETKKPKCNYCNKQADFSMFRRLPEDEMLL